MSTKNATETEPDDLATEIALFRYGLIAQLVHTPPDKGQQEALLREIAARAYHIPGSQRTHVTPKAHHAPALPPDLPGARL